jgi:hypothetical protein
LGVRFGRPSGTGPAPSPVFPGFRCAPPWAIFGAPSGSGTLQPDRQFSLRAMPDPSPAPATICVQPTVHISKRSK